MGSGEGQGTGSKRKTKQGCVTKQVTGGAVDKRCSVPREPSDHADHVAQSYALAGKGAAVFIHQVPRLSRGLRASLGWGLDPGREGSGCRGGPQGEGCRPRNWKRGVERAGDEGGWLGSYRRGPDAPQKGGHGRLHHPGPTPALRTHGGPEALRAGAALARGGGSLLALQPTTLSGRECKRPYRSSPDGAVVWFLAPSHQH